MRIIIILLFCCVSPKIIAQKLPQLNDLLLQQEQIILHGDSVHFLVTTNINEAKKKPLILILQGSMPVPLVIYGDEGTYNPFVFDYKNYLDQYVFAIISKPSVPLMVHEKKLKNGFQYVGATTGKAPKAYSERNHLDYYVARADKVIHHLWKSGRIDTNKLVVMGGSEGSTVGAKLCTVNDKITHLIYYSGNPAGRYESLIRQARRDALLGKMTQEQAQQKINELYKRWEYICSNRNDTDDKHGDTNKAWYTFSQPPLVYLLQIDIPILVAYGTNDVGAETNDLLPLSFARAGKKNLTLLPYLHYNHSFFEVQYDAAEKQIGQVYKMDESFQDFINWVKEN